MVIDSFHHTLYPLSSRITSEINLTLQRSKYTIRQLSMTCPMEHLVKKLQQHGYVDESYCTFHFQPYYQKNVAREPLSCGRHVSLTYASQQLG